MLFIVYYIQLVSQLLVLFLILFKTSNGTFIGEQKILPGREVTLLKGDYIGIGCPAVGPVFEELYCDSENIARPFAFLVECISEVQYVNSEINCDSWILILI